MVESSFLNSPLTLLDNFSTTNRHKILLSPCITFSLRVARGEGPTSCQRLEEMGELIGVAVFFGFSPRFGALFCSCLRTTG
jgi:hypothetical protein